MTSSQAAQSWVVLRVPVQTDAKTGGVTINIGEGTVELPIWQCTKHAIVCSKIGLAFYELSKHRDPKTAVAKLKEIV